MFESPNCSTLSLEDSCLGTPWDQSPEPHEPHAPSTGHAIWAPLSSPPGHMSRVVVETFQIPDCCFTQPCPGLNSFFLFLVVVVFLSLQTDRELGIAAKECACSPLQLFWGCNPSGLGPDLPPPPDISLPTRTLYVPQRSLTAIPLQLQHEPTKHRAIFLKAPPPASILSLPLLSALPQPPFCLFSLSPPQPLLFDWVEVTVKAGHKSKLKTGW